MYRLCLHHSLYTELTIFTLPCTYQYFRMLEYEESFGEKGENAIFSRKCLKSFLGSQNRFRLRHLPSPLGNNGKRTEHSMKTIFCLVFYIFFGLCPGKIRYCKFLRSEMRSVNSSCIHQSTGRGGSSKESNNSEEGTCRIKIGSIGMVQRRIKRGMHFIVLPLRG